MTIDTIPWELINHAYGPADDIPVILEAIGSGDADRGAKAWMALTGNVYHQGTRYSATFPTCRVLADLAMRPQVAERGQLWQLVQILGVDGCQRSDSPNQQAIINQLAWTLHVDGDECCSDREHDWAIHDCYLLLSSMTNELIEAARNPTDHRLAVSAAYVLAFLPWHGRVNATELMDMALDRKRNSSVRCSCLLAACSFSNEQVARALAWFNRQPENTDGLANTPLNLFELGILSLAGKPLPESFETLGKRYASFGAEADSDLYPDSLGAGFPWRDFSHDLRWLRPADEKEANVIPRSLQTAISSKATHAFDPDRFPVTTGDFSQPNVEQAVQRYHFNRLCGGPQLSEEHALFSQFIPHVPELAWSVVGSLLNHDDERERTCAVRWCSNLKGLLEEQIDELLDRVVDENRVDLSNLLFNQSFTREHCVRLMKTLLQDSLPPTTQSVFFDLWLRKADFDLLTEALETFPKTSEKEILRMLSFRGHLSGEDERLLKPVVTDLRSDVYADRTWAQMLVRRDPCFLKGLLQHADSLDAEERILLLRELRSSKSTSGSMQDEILNAYDNEVEPRAKLHWLMLIANFNQANVSLLDWIESRWQASEATPSGLTSHFRFAFVEVMGSLFHKSSISCEGELPSDLFERIFLWLKARSQESDSATRKQARRWILSHPAKETRQHALQVIEAGLQDPVMENRRDALFSLYRVFGNDVEAIAKRLKAGGFAVLAGDREMILELTRSVS